MFGVIKGLLSASGDENEGILLGHFGEGAVEQAVGRPCPRIPLVPEILMDIASGQSQEAVG